MVHTQTSDLLAVVLNCSWDCALPAAWPLTFDATSVGEIWILVGELSMSKAGFSNKSSVKCVVLLPPARPSVHVCTATLVVVIWWTMSWPAGWGHIADTCSMTAELWSELIMHAFLAA